MCDKGFIKANFNNIPHVNIFMIRDFLKNDIRFNSPEVRGAKASRVSCESYGDKAIGYVQLNRNNGICTVKGRICPEHRVRSKAYSVTLTINEKLKNVQDVQCYDCAASAVVVEAKNIKIADFGHSNSIKNDEQTATLVCSSSN